MDIIIKEKNVHSRNLADDLNEHTKLTVNLFLDIISDMEACVLLINMMLESEADFYKLHQINVIGDSRNNKVKDAEQGKYVIDVYYKQINCYNVTHISYIIRN